MAFRKIDLDAVAGDEPLDAYALHGAAANDDAARENRGRRASHTFALAHRPTLGAYRTFARPLCMWPLAPGTAQVTVRLRCAVQDASVLLGLAVYDPTTRTLTQTDLDTTATTSTTNVTLTADVSGLAGTVGLFLLFRSVKSATVTKHTYNNTTVLFQAGRLDFDGGHPFALNPAKRYVVEFEDDTTPRPDAQYPPPLELIEWDDTTDKNARGWPFVDGGWFDFQGTSADFEVSVTLLGSLILHGYSVADSGWDARPSAQALLQPAFPPAVPPASALHARLRAQHVQRTAVHALAPTPDTQDLDGDGRVVDPFGRVVSLYSLTSSWRQVSAAYVGGYEDDQTTVDRPSAATYTRSTLIVAGLLAVDGGGQVSGRTVQVSARVKAYSWDAGTWDGDAETLPDADGLPIVAPVMGRVFEPQIAGYYAGGLINVPFGPSSAVGGETWHTLRGCWPLLAFREPSGFVDDLPQQLGGGLVPFELEVTDPETGVDRALVIELQATPADLQGGAATALKGTLAALTIYTRPEVI
jgi:hypothetical protein